MRRRSSFDDKAQSLVFTFAGQLLEDDEFGAPQPDFLKWMENSLFADLISTGDEVEFDKLSEDERRAWRCFHDAIEATGNVLEIYKTDMPLFQKVSEQLMLLPCFMSRHPDNQRFNRSLFEASKFARQNTASGSRPKAKHLAHQSWPVRYAYVIINTIELTLDMHGNDLPYWAKIYGYGVKHPIPLETYEATARKAGWDEETIRQELPKYEGRYRILPLWTETLKKLRRPFNQHYVLDYWHSGKEMILEEMPDFHMRPEWANYREKRAYQAGRKKGAIQHAIFKDILTALRSIAGYYHGRSASKSVTK